MFSAFKAPIKVLTNSSVLSILKSGAIYSSNSSAFSLKITRALSSPLLLQSASFSSSKPSPPKPSPTKPAKVVKKKVTTKSAVKNIAKNKDQKTKKVEGKKAQNKIKEKEKTQEKKEALLEKKKLQARKEKEKEVQAKAKKRERDEKEKEKMKLVEEKEKQKRLLEEKKEKKARAPRRPRSAYVIFMTKSIVASKKSQPNTKVTEIMKACSKKWNALSDSEKKSYVEEAKKDRTRYEKEKAEAAKLAPPKRPLSSFILFANEVRPSLLKTTSDIAEIGKKIGEKWRKLSDVEKEKYVKLSKKGRDEYLKKAEAFKKN